jgi:hypothetical protein
MHGTAMVFHFNELFNSYLQEHAPGVNVRHGRSDGCRGQFKGRNFFGWLSEYWSSFPPGKGVKMNWSQNIVCLIACVTPSVPQVVFLLMPWQVLM